MQTIKDYFPLTSEDKMATPYTAKYLLRAAVFLLPLYCGTAMAVTSTINQGSSSTLTYAPTIQAGTNTNLTTYSNSFRWIYTLHSFRVCQSGAYSASSTTTHVVNTTFFLNGTFTPSDTFPPPTPISNFFVSNFSGTNTSTFSGMNLVAGQQYSVLIAYNQTTAGSYPYTNTLTMDGPGTVIFNNSGSCASGVQAVPSLSEWAQILLGLSIMGIAGWQLRRHLS
ncbi:IPTL-CTERM sorting domain-containing protein [Paracidovorax sp. MALMAid1276]|uniref:IPTL-CTERM sorting domain-containing protein n=1 Tax=Paracidovorax sp. MALMAid1276 TaxID=3411631 RepID=UPI003B99D8EF